MMTINWLLSTRFVAGTRRSAGLHILLGGALLVDSQACARADYTLLVTLKQGFGNNKQQHDPCGNAKVKVVEIPHGNRDPGFSLSTNYIWTDPYVAWQSYKWNGVPWINRPGEHFIWPDTRWVFNANVSKNSGLELRDVILNSASNYDGNPRSNSRYMAKTINVEEYKYTPPQTDPFSSSQPVVKKLDRQKCVGMSHSPASSAPGTTPYHMEASYVDNDICLIVDQDYVFEPADRDKELSQRFNAARVRPKIRFVYEERGSEVSNPYSDFTFRTDCEFAPSLTSTQGSVGDAELISDSQSIPDGAKAAIKWGSPLLAVICQSVNLGTAYFPYAHTSVIDRTGPFWTVVRDGESEIHAYQNSSGGDIRNPDNLHLNFRPTVSWPTSYGQPGCPECVHIHWNWTKLYDYATDPSFAVTFGGIYQHIVENAPPEFREHPMLRDSTKNNGDNVILNLQLAQTVKVGSFDGGRTFTYIAGGNTKNPRGTKVGGTIFAEGIFYGPQGDEHDVTGKVVK